MMYFMRYPGGKEKCYQRLINLMPPHQVYIESHLGGGAVLRHKRPAEVSIGIDADVAVIAYWAKNFPGSCHLVNEDAASYLAQYAYTGAELIYADPPYLATVRRQSKIYRHEYSEQDHIELLATLLQAQCMVMLSGYDNELYNDTLTGWRKVQFFTMTHIGVRQEHVWMNFSEPQKLHDGSYLGNTFRERQTIKRRQARLVKKFRQMDPIERSEALEVLNRTFNTREEDV